MRKQIHIEEGHLLDYVKRQAKKTEDEFSKEELTIRFSGISDEQYDRFKEYKNLKDLTLDNCMVRNAHRLAEFNLKSLTLYNCHIGDYSFIGKMTGLRHLTIVHDNVDAGIINTLKDLEYLNISSSFVKDYENLDLPSLRDLSIDGSDIRDLKFFRRMPKLKYLAIDEDQYFQNKFRIIFLILKRVEVRLDGLIDLGSLIRCAPWDWWKKPDYPG